MPRPRRIFQDEYAYHIGSRINNKEWLFTKRRRKAVIHIVAGELVEVGRRFGFRLHDIILMVNHYHMIGHTSGENLDRVMQYFNSQVARKFNKLVGRSGHLWGRRYHDTILDSEEAYERCVRYIYSNPYRAGYRGREMVEELRERSTFSFYAFGERVDVVVTPDGWYVSLASEERERQREFRERMFSPMDEAELAEVREALRHQAWGRMRFLVELRERFGERLRLGRIKPTDAVRVE